MYEILETSFGSMRCIISLYVYPGVVTLSFMSIHSEGLCHLSFFFLFFSFSVGIMLQVFAWCFLFLHPGRFFVTFQFVWAEPEAQSKATKQRVGSIKKG